MNHKFIVITKTPKVKVNDEHHGNLADEILVRHKGNLFVGCDFEDGELEKADSVVKQELVFVKSPVFTEGEIVIVGESDREICGMGRKPYKWWVEYETFDDIEKAIKRAVEIGDVYGKAILDRIEGEKKVKVKGR